MFAHLDGRDVKSARELCARVGGNKNTAAWVSEAIKAGEIVITNGILRLPEAVSTRHEARSLPLLRKQLLDLIEGMNECCPDIERGYELVRTAIRRLNTAAIMIGCEWELDPESDWYAHNKEIQKFWKDYPELVKKMDEAIAELNRECAAKKDLAE